MFRRLIAEEWQATLTIASFSIFAVVFLIWLVRVWCMSRQTVEKLGNLPLGEERPISHEPKA